MALNELPNLWTSDSLGELVIVERGSSPRPIKNFLTEDNGVNWIKIGDVKEGQKYVTKTKEQITKEGAEKSRFVKVGDFILSNSMSFGRPYIMAIDGYIHDGWFALRLPKDINSDYFYYLLSSSYVQDQFSQLAVGGVVKNISGDLVKKAELPLPPLAEQRVIAEKLDKLLAKVDSIKARLDAVPDTLKRFRQSVLAAAVSGKLTEEWRGNSKSISSNYIEWGWTEVPDGWRVEAYCELVESRLGKMLDKSKNTGLPTSYLGNINVRWFEFNLDNVQEILVSESERSELSLQHGDVLICEGGEPGRCAIWKQETNEPIVFQKALHRARVRGKISPTWLVYNLKNDADNLMLSQLFTGTTIKHLTGKALKKYPIRVPSLEEQAEIVRRVEKLFAYADKVEAEVNAAQERVNKLTQSILAKAFRGELTAKWREQNPELISGENSAEALLASIQKERKAEREKLKLKKKAKSKKTVKTK